MSNTGRILAFVIVLVALIGAGAAVASFVASSRPAPNGAPVEPTGVKLGLCGIASPERMVLQAYLNARSAELEQPAGDDDTPVTFIIASGESVAQIAERLAEKGLISDAELFRRYVQYHGLDSSIEAGQFTLRRTMTIPEIAQALQRGSQSERIVVIREGLRLEEVAEQVALQTTIPYADFVAVATGGWHELGLEAQFEFLAAIPPTATLEGFLFPDTYRVAEDTSAAELVQRMLANFNQRVTPEIRAAATSRGLGLYDLITLASIVEREARLAEERPLIAGVFYNRLQANYPLESCPTVQYSLGSPGNWWPSLTLEDLERDLPTSTYQRSGLPPMPICNPGLASIEAAAHPAQTDYFFFLANCIKNDGSHFFSTTLEEHLQYYAQCGASSLP